MEKKTKVAQKKLDTSILFMIAAVLAVFVAIPQLVQLQSGERSPNKPFVTFDEFYPFYLTQHQDVTCVRLHVIGTSIILLMSILLEPLIFPSLIMAAMIGYSAHIATVNLDHGVYEMILMLMTFQLFMRRLTGSWMKGLAVPIVAYTFAWVGHFYFEHNKPATFVYPVYSLAGDFRMFFEVLSRQKAF